MAKFDAAGGLGESAQKAVAEAAAQQAIDAAKTKNQAPAEQQGQGATGGSLSFRNWPTEATPEQNRAMALDAQRAAYSERMNAAAFLREQGLTEAAERLEGRAKIDRVVDGAVLHAGAAIDKTAEAISNGVDRGIVGLEKIVGALPRYAETAKKVGKAGAKVGAAVGGVAVLTAAVVNVPFIVAGGASAYVSAGLYEAGKKYGEARANKEKGEAEPAPEAFKIPGARKIYNGLVRASDAMIDYASRAAAGVMEWLNKKSIRTNDERSTRQKALIEMKAATPEGKKAAENITKLEAQRAALREKAANAEAAFQRMYSVEDTDFAAIYSEDHKSAAFKDMINSESSVEEQVALGEDSVTDKLEETISEGAAISGLAETVKVAALNGWPTDVLIEQFKARSGFDDPMSFDLETWSHERAEEVLGRELTDRELTFTKRVAKKLVSKKNPFPVASGSASNV